MLFNGKSYVVEVPAKAGNRIIQGPAAKEGQTRIHCSVTFGPAQETCHDLGEKKLFAATWVSVAWQDERLMFWLCSKATHWH